MRHEPNLRIENYRRQHPTIGSGKAWKNWGYFQIGPLRIISSGCTEDNPVSQGWEHVSVSCANRTPTWQEMAKVKDLFWRDDETVVQFHPRKDKYINAHPYCLHLWKRGDREFELPPDDLLV